MNRYFQVRTVDRTSRICHHVAQNRPSRIAVIEVLLFVDASSESNLVKGQHSKTSLYELTERRPEILVVHPIEIIHGVSGPSTLVPVRMKPDDHGNFSRGLPRR